MGSIGVISSVLQMEKLRFMYGTFLSCSHIVVWIPDPHSVQCAMLLVLCFQHQIYWEWRRKLLDDAIPQPYGYNTDSFNLENVKQYNEF